MQKRLFIHLINWCCNTRNAAALDIPELDGKTQQAWLIGKTDDISHLLVHDLYDPFGYIIKTARENLIYLKKDKVQIGIYLDLSRNPAEINAYYVLNQQGCIITRTDLRPFSADIIWGPIFRNHIETFDRKIKCCWKLDDETDIQQAAPTFPAFDTNLLPP